MLPIFSSCSTCWEQAYTFLQLAVKYRYEQIVAPKALPISNNIQWNDSKSYLIIIIIIIIIIISLLPTGIHFIGHCSVADKKQSTKRIWHPGMYLSSYHSHNKISMQRQNYNNRHTISKTHVIHCMCQIII